MNVKKIYFAQREKNIIQTIMDEENSNSDKKMSRKPSGILRVDTSNKPRRLSGSSVEFNLQPELLGCEVSGFCMKKKKQINALIYLIKYIVQFVLK